MTQINVTQIRPEDEPELSGVCNFTFLHIYIYIHMGFVRSGVCTLELSGVCKVTFLYCRII